MDIIIGGDLVPTESNINFFNHGDVEALIGNELHSIWNAVDFRIFNIETPLTDREQPIDKCGPNLISPTTVIEGIKQLNPSLVTLANNHILDQGYDGLKSTMNMLDITGIPHIGAGENLNQAMQPYVLQKGNIKIGVYTCAEHEFTIATDNMPGANPFDPLESFDHIQNLKKDCDYVIVLYHGGKEHYRYPSPYLQRVCRKMVDKGADVIICQHSHCIGCYENYKDSTIVYGQGNFIFDESDSVYWQTSVLVKLEITDYLTIKYIPVVKRGSVIRLAESRVAEEILFGLHSRSEEILQEKFIERQYQKVASDGLDLYLRTFCGMGKWLSRIDHKILKGKLIKRNFSKKNMLTIQNYIECEAHRELVLRALKGEIKGG